MSAPGEQVVDEAAVPPPGPFAGLRVVDLSRALAGPYCTMMLGDLGADVVKVEDRAGDESRQWPPFANGMSALFLAVNRNKRSICLDLRSEDGRRLVQDLIRSADVLVENFRTGVAKQLGLEYSSLKAGNEGLVHCSISGYGRTGPWADVPAYDSTMQAFGGLMSCTGESDGRPVRAGYSVVDISTGLLAYASIVSALLIRARGGSGQHVETSLLDSQIAFLSSHATAFSIDGRVPTRTGTAHNWIAPIQSLRTSDGELMVAAPSDSTFGRLCAALGQPQLTEDPLFQTNDARHHHRGELASALEARTMSMSNKDVSHALTEAGVAHSMINSVEETIQSEPVRARNLVLTEEHPVAGRILVQAPVLKLADNPGRITSHAPLLGQHSREILMELGLPESSVEDLYTKGAVIS